ncbi:Arc family DNA-binding protein [Halomonas sp.]|uniref:Arc family DNA-binding protein n=1 Tax=Halomonas sp. TaxID=1486246 RepID=UPI003D152086
MSRTDPQFKLRVPLELKEQIEKAAEENHRSMNAEIVARLQSTFEEHSLYGHKLSPEVLALGANDLAELKESVEGVIHTLLRANEVLHIAQNQAQGVERRADDQQEDEGGSD